MILGVLFISQCKKYQYFGEITIVNFGDIDIYAGIEDDMLVLEPGESFTWEVGWKNNGSSTFYLYAEPVGYNDYDEAYINLFNGEAYTWFTGWEYVYQGRTPMKKQSTLKKKS